MLGKDILLFFIGTTSFSVNDLNFNANFIFVTRKY